MYNFNLIESVTWLSAVKCREDLITPQLNSGTYLCLDLSKTTGVHQYVFVFENNSWSNDSILIAKNDSI